MSERLFGLVELIGSYGIVLALLIWQLVRIRRSIRADREKAAREKSEADGT